MFLRCSTLISVFPHIHTFTSHVISFTTAFTSFFILTHWPTHFPCQPSTVAIPSSSCLSYPNTLQSFPSLYKNPTFPFSLLHSTLTLRTTTTSTSWTSTTVSLPSSNISKVHFSHDFHFLCIPLFYDLHLILRIGKFHLHLYSIVHPLAFSLIFSHGLQYCWCFLTWWCVVGSIVENSISGVEFLQIFVSLCREMQSCRHFFF